MKDQRVAFLPKVRSGAIMRAMKNYDCTVRVSNFIPGHDCAPQSTVVGAHLPVIGKGVGTKVTDLAVVAACHHCHLLIDGVDARANQLVAMYPAAYHMRLLQALVETQAMLVRDLVIEVPDGEIV
jgi:hypothetical protein